MLASVASSIVITVAAPLSLAQEVTGNVEQRSVDIPAGLLGDALFAITDAFGANIIADQTLTVGKKAPSVVSAISAGDALDRVLEGSGLEYRLASNGAYIIAAIAPPSAEPVPEPLPTRNDPTEAPLVEETIVVTGTKQNLSLQETQASVSVLTQEIVDQRAIFNLTDALIRTPNVSTGTAVRELSIRGIEVGGIGSAGVAATANVYVDGAPASISGRQGPFNLWDVSQVEILRGPQSTIQGRNSLAGAIVLQTADPEYVFGSQFRALVGTNDNLQVSGAVTGPIISDQVAFRVSADYREIDYGVTDIATGDPAFFDEDLTVRAKLLFEPEAVPDLRLELNSQYVESQGGSNFAVFSPVLFSDPAFTDFDPFGDETFPQVQFSEETTFRNIVDVSYDFSPNWEGILIGTYEVSEGFQDRSTGENDNQEETLSLEARAVFDYEKVTGWIGAYAFREDLESSNLFEFDLNAFGIPTDPVGSFVRSGLDLERETENYAVFADISYRVTDNITLNFGARYDFEDLFDTGFQGFAESDPEGCVLPAFGGIPCTSFFPASSDPAIETDYEAFLPRGSIIYDINDQQSLSLSVQRGYRAGGASVETTADGAAIREFDPEFIANYEIAYRSTWYDNRLKFNLNAFWADWTDQQIRIRDRVAGGTLFVINAASSEFYGLEVSTSFDITDQLEIFASLGLLETEFTDFPFGEDETGAPLPGDGVTLPVENTGFANLAGNEFPFAPPVTLSAGISYDQGPGFFASGNIAYSDGQFSDVENLEVNKTDSYTLVNARTGYRWADFELSVFANNLFDERFVTRQFVQFVNTANQQVRIQDGNGQFRINTPQTIGVELKAKF